MSAVDELLRLFQLRPSFPDSTPRISHRQLAKRLGVSRPTMRELIEHNLEDLPGVLVMQGEGKPNYWCDERSVLFLAGRVGTDAGDAVLVEMIQAVGSLSSSQIRELSGDGPLADIAAMFERGGRS